MRRVEPLVPSAALHPTCQTACPESYRVRAAELTWEITRTPGLVRSRLRHADAVGDLGRRYLSKVVVGDGQCLLARAIAATTAGGRAHHSPQPTRGDPLTLEARERPPFGPDRPASPLAASLSLWVKSRYIKHNSSLLSPHCSLIPSALHSLHPRSFLPPSPTRPTGLFLETSRAAQFSLFPGTSSASI